MKTIKNLSASLNISKEAIYKKIKIQLKHELKDHIIKKNNITYIDEEGEKIIAQSLKPDKNQSELQKKLKTHLPKTIFNLQFNLTNKLKHKLKTQNI